MNGAGWRVLGAQAAGGRGRGRARGLLGPGSLDPGAETVITNSGDGLKTRDAVAGCLRAEPVAPTVESFRRAGS